jgi:hypothetical protein
LPTIQERSQYTAKRRSERQLRQSHWIHFLPVGTFCFNSSNQFCTTTICVRSDSRLPGCELILWRKRQQDIARYPAKAWVAGIDINHAIYYHGARSIHRPAFRLDSVRGGIVFCRVKVPENFSVFTRKCTHVPVDRARKNYARNYRDRTRLGRTATGSRRIARMTRHGPDFPAVFHTHCRQSAPH